MNSKYYIRKKSPLWWTLATLKAIACGAIGCAFFATMYFAMWIFLY